MYLDEYVETTLNQATIKYYKQFEDIEIPMRLNRKNKLVPAYYEKMMVKVNQLPPSSTVKVRVCCDDCLDNGVLTILNRDYCDCRKEEDRHMCFACSKVFLGKRKQKIHKATPEDVYNEFIERDYTPLFSINDYKNNRQILQYICNKHPNKIQDVRFSDFRNNGTGCVYCAIETRPQNMRGVKCSNWKHGLSSLYSFLRTSIVEWKFKSFKHYNFSCAVTGIKSNGELIVHHLRGFDLIMNEVIVNTNIDARPCLKDYNQNELDILSLECKTMHEKYGLGVVLHPLIHNLFHHLYRYGKNTPEQFEEFKQRLKQGEFNTYLEENNLKLAL